MGSLVACVASRVVSPWKGIRMLVLSRKCGEQILIGEGLSVVVQAVAKGRVRLGIVAPSNIKILRAELVSAVAAAASPLRQADRPSQPR